MYIYIYILIYEILTRFVEDKNCRMLGFNRESIQRYAVVFKPMRRALRSDVSFEYKREQIEIVQEYKYLGINIQSNLIEKSDISRVTASLIKTF